MSILEKMCAIDGCLQCWAEQMVSVAPVELEAALAEEIVAEPTMRVIGPPEGEELKRIARSGRREVRIFARTALLEPHECGRTGSKGV